MVATVLSSGAVGWTHHGIGEDVATGGAPRKTSRRTFGRTADREQGISRLKGTEQTQNTLHIRY